MPIPTDTRWVALQGAVNVRDLGGLPLADGGRTARGVVLRADNLQDLTATDIAELVERRRVRVVVDLRTGAEVDLEGPGPLVGDPRVDIRHRSLYPEVGERTDVMADEDRQEEEDGVLPWQVDPVQDGHGDTPAVRAYLGYLRDRPDSIVAALRDVARAEGAVLVHCAAGKDRTGVVCALALEAAGVEREAVIADYVATGTRLEKIVERLASSPTYLPDIENRTTDSHRPRPETMQRVLEVLDERCGGAARWLERHGFGEDDRAALRRRLAG